MIKIPIDFDIIEIIININILKPTLESLKLFLKPLALTLGFAITARESMTHEFAIAFFPLQSRLEAPFPSFPSPLWLRTA